jgi:hypothetical protein
MDWTYFQVVVGVVSLGIAIYTIRQHRKAVWLFGSMFFLLLCGYFVWHWLWIPRDQHVTVREDEPQPQQQLQTASLPNPPVAVSTDVKSNEARSPAQGSSIPEPQPKENSPIENLTFTLSADVTRLSAPLPGCSRHTADNLICGQVITSVSLYRAEANGYDWEDGALLDKNNGQLWLVLSRGELKGYNGSRYFDDALTRAVSIANSRRFLTYGDWRLPSAKDVKGLFAYWNKLHRNVWKSQEQDLGWSLSFIPTSDTCTSPTGAGFIVINSDNQRSYCFDKISGNGGSAYFGLWQMVFVRQLSAS